MIEIKFFENENGSVTLETVRYGNEGVAASFAVVTTPTRTGLNKITTVKEKQITIDTITQIKKFADHLLKSEGVEAEAFSEMKIGQEFDFVSPDPKVRNSFFDRCVKISPRKYRSLQTGLEMSVGTIRVRVYNVTEGHERVLSGLCSVCGHYGDDCTAYVKEGAK
jgi:hypothetical protein